MNSDEEDAPQYLVNKINRVFDAVTRPRKSPQAGDEVTAPATVRRRRGEAALAASSPSNGGGFIPASPPSGGGGFIVEEDDSDHSQQGAEWSTTNTATHIPIAMIPSALQMLDLPPADEEVLEVFRNAAGGWDGSSDGQKGVSRKDWKAVCLILLSQQEQPRSSSGDEMMEDATQQQEESSGNDSDDDEYRNMEGGDWVDDEPSDDDEEDGYTQTSKRAADRKGKGKVQPPSKPSRGRKRRRDSFEDEDDPPKSMTRRQKAASRQAFALFFPGVEDKDLDSQKIMIKDIVRVSGLVKEKLSAEDVVEMLNEFSTGPDKSISLEDFERMMMVAKLA